MLSPSAIADAAAARRAGDWRAAAAFARTDVDVDLDALRERHGDAAVDAVEDDLRHLALDLLWWHLPRHTGGMTTLRARTAAILAPATGATEALLIRVGLPLAPTGPQRLSLTVVDDFSDERWFFAPRHTWDVRVAPGLRAAWGGSVERPPLLTSDGRPMRARDLGLDDDAAADTERIYRLLVDGDPFSAWFECGIELDIADNRPLHPDSASPTCPVGVADDARAVARAFGEDTVSTVFATHLNLTMSTPIQASGWDPQDYLDVPWRIATAPVPADLVLLYAGMQTPDDLHPLIRASLFPDRAETGATTRFAPAVEPGAPVRVRCGADWHRVAVADGELRLDDHDPDEVRRERMLRSLGGTSTGCFAVREQWTTGATRLPRDLAAQRREIRRRAQNGETDWLLDEIALGSVDPRMRDANGWTLLHMAMWMDWERLAPLVVGHGVPIDVTDRIGRTPLYVAVHQGGPAAYVHWLLDHGADPNASTEHGADTFSVLYRSRRSDLDRIDALRTARRRS
jgi:hypothetical protein